MSQAVKYPKLLPKDTHFTQLIIEDAHCRIIHSGVSQTLTTIRQQYWILQGRAIVKVTKGLQGMQTNRIIECLIFHESV